MSNSLTKQYEELCKIFGDLSYKREQIENQLADVRKKLEGVNLAAAFSAPQPNPAEKLQDQIKDFVKEREKSGAKVELVDKSPV